jgi:hypothetical protein
MDREAEEFGVRFSLSICSFPSPFRVFRNGEGRVGLQMGIAEGGLGWGWGTLVPVRVGPSSGLPVCMDRDAGECMICRPVRHREAHSNWDGGSVVPYLNLL